MTLKKLSIFHFFFFIRIGQIGCAYEFCTHFHAWVRKILNQREKFIYQHGLCENLLIWGSCVPHFWVEITTKSKSYYQFYFAIKILLRDGLKFIGYPGRVIFFSRKKGEFFRRRRLFLWEKTGQRHFYEKN